MDLFICHYPDICISICCRLTEDPGPHTRPAIGSAHHWVLLLLFLPADLPLQMSLIVIGHSSLFSSTYNKLVYFICLCTSIHRNSSQLECIHLYSYVSISTLLHHSAGNNTFPLLSCMIDCGSLVQLMNICLVFMAFKCHQLSRLAL